MKKTIALLLSLMLIFALAGCGGKQPDAPWPTETPAASDVPAAPTETPAEPATQRITDALGREVEVPAQVERIVTIGNTQRLATYLGLAEKVVGATKLTRENIAGVTSVTPFAYVNKDLWADLPCVGDGNGDDVYVEEVLALEPDVVMCATISEEAVRNLASQTQLPVVYVQADTVFTEPYNQAILIMGQACGAAERAQEVVDYINEAFRDLDARTRDIPEEGKPAALSAGATFRGAHGIEGVRLKDTVLDAVHGYNVAASSFDGAASAEVDREQILLWDPDVIFCDYSGVKLIREDYKANAEYYRQLKACQNGRMYQHPNNTSYYGNLELPVANAYYMGSVLYPEAFQDIDVREEINQVLEFFVGVTDYYSLLEADGAGYGVIRFD